MKIIKEVWRATPFLLLGFSVFWAIQSAFSFSTHNTHPVLSEEIARFFNRKGKQFISDQEIKWLRQGAEREDEPPRYINHFYNPITGAGWSGKHFGRLSPEEGLSQVTGSSPRLPLPSIDWVTNQEYQSAYGAQYGNQTWQKAIKAYLDGDKKEAFLALGHTLHLIEDLGVPDHTRDDTHVEGLYGDPGSPFEKYAKDYTNFNQLAVAEDLADKGEKPLEFNNIQSAFVYLANYSNSNFFSEDTINNEEFGEPNLKTLDKRIEVIGEKRTLFLHDKKRKADLAFLRDENKFSIDNPSFVLPSYRDHLFPQIVLTGAGVIELFFREAEKYRAEPELLERIAPNQSEPFLTALKRAPVLVLLKASNALDKYKTALAVTAGKSQQAAKGLAVAGWRRFRPAPDPINQDEADTENSQPTDSSGQVLGEEVARGDKPPVSPPRPNQPQNNKTKQASVIKQKTEQTKRTEEIKPPVGSGGGGLEEEAESDPEMVNLDPLPINDSAGLSAPDDATNSPSFNLDQIPINQLTNQPINTPPPPSFFFVMGQDTVPPTSSITALPAVTATSTFTVSWQGKDNIQVAPASFDLQYRIDGGAWLDWLSKTSATSTFFIGEDERTYGWRSRARDREGNVSQYPEGAETTTYVNLSVPGAPIVTSHSNGQTLLYSADADSVATGVQAALAGNGDPLATVSISLTEAGQTATTAVSSLGDWTQSFTLLEGTNNFSLYSTEADGDISTTTAFSLVLNTAPGAITSLALDEASTTATSVKLTWFAPSQANLNIAGQAAYYDIRYVSGSGCTLDATSFALATGASNEPVPTASAGTSESLTIAGLTPGATYCFTLKTHNGLNESALSNVVSITLPASGVDQTQLVSNANQLWGWNNNGSYNSIANSFVPTVATLKGVALEMCRTGTVTNQTLALRIYNGASFGSGSQVGFWQYNVATQAQRDVINALIPLCDSYQFVTLGLGTNYSSGSATALPLTPGASYHFVLESGNGNIYRNKYQSSGDVYSSGQMARREVSNWSALPSADLTFKTLW